MTSEKAAQPTLETILRPGQTVAGKYCVDHLIAAGGMAAVWAGINLRTGKRVALKVILRSFAATPGAEELFRREALAASRVNHPNVVTIFDVVDHASRTCIVMEFLDGEDLGTYFERQGLLGLEEAVALLLPAMRGVAAANAQGVVHRDLKPKNIFLCIGPDGRLITTKILDFGISVIAEKATEERSKTIQLTTHGTPAYMSPEHITGSPNIDERADVYGFGVILFEALAGQAPFIGPAGAELLTRILEERVPKLTVFRSDLSPRMDEILERALAKSPDDRFPTLNHFIAALEDHVLPRSPILRSLTPTVGVPMTDSGSGPRGLADPIVRIARREPSGEHDGGGTKAMYVLSRTVPSKRDEQPSQPTAAETAASETPAPVEHKFEEPSPPAPRPGRVRISSSDDDDTASLVLAVQRRTRMWRLLVLAAAVGGVSVGVAWYVIPGSGHESGRPRPEDVVTMPVPPVAARPAAPSAAAPALPVALPREVAEPARGEMAATVDKAPGEESASLQARAEARMRTAHSGAEGRARGAARGAGRTRGSATGRWDEMPASTIEPPPPSSAAPDLAEKGHRAGALSTDDF